MIKRFVFDNWGLGTGVSEQPLPEGPWEGIAIGTCSEHDIVYVRDVPSFGTDVGPITAGTESSHFSRTARCAVGSPLIVPPGNTWRPTLTAARGNMRGLVTSRLAASDAPGTTAESSDPLRLMLSRLEVVLFERACDALAWPRHRALWDGVFNLTDTSDIAGGLGSLFVPFAGRRHLVVRARRDTATTIEVRGLSLFYGSGGRQSSSGGYFKELLAATAIPADGTTRPMGVWHVGGTNEEEAFEVLEVRIDAGDASAGDVTDIHVEAFGELGR